LMPFENHIENLNKTKQYNI